MTSRLLLFFCLLLAISGCGSSSIRYQGSIQPLRHRAAIVLVPGFYGTALADAETGERYFLSAWKSLFSSVPLALTPPDLGIEGARPLRPDGMLESIRIVPGIYSVNVYGEALDFLRAEFGGRAEIVPFAYDWRGDLWEDTDQLAKVVDGLAAAGASPIVLVGHSMGGLITAHYLLRYPTSPVRAAVIAAAPFGGVASAFRNLQIGTSLGLAKTPLSALSVSTFPSMYYLMSAPDSAAYRNRNFQVIPTSIYQIALWKRNHWGLLRETVTDGSPLAARREAATAKYLRQAEVAAALLRTRLRTPSDKRVLVYIGTGQQTFARVQWTGESLMDDGHWLFREKSVRALAARATLFDDGDGTVPAFAATPPRAFVESFRTQIVTGPATHAGMFGEGNFRRALREFLEMAGGLSASPR